VGQPRQRQWKASYLIFSNEPEIIQYRSVAYDLHSAQAKIREAQLPEYLAERLETGV
jgi:hypothetical protein